MRVVFVGHTSALSPLQVGSHHLARALVEQGHRVVHVSAPLTPLHLAAWRDPSVRARLRRAVVTTPGGLVELTPRLVVSLRALEARPGAGDRLWRLGWPALPRTLARLGTWPVDRLIIDYPYGAGLVVLLRPARSTYRATDVYPVLRGRPRLVEVERRIVAEVDDLVATSGTVAEHLRSLDRRDRPVTVIPNGAPSPPATVSPAVRALVADVTGPTAVYAGAVDDRFDRDLLLALLDGVPELTALIVGPPPRPPLPGRPDLQVTGPLAHHDLMALLTLVDVGLLPTNDHPGNAGRSPIKAFEHVAAGLPTVARRTPELARLDLPGVALYDDPAGAVAATRAALATTRPSGTALEDARREVSWAQRADDLLAAGQADRMPRRIGAGYADRREARARPSGAEGPSGGRPTRS